MNKELQEQMAIAGYEQAMKNLDHLYPLPEGLPKFVWDTENENCKNDWRRIAKTMYEMAMNFNRQKDEKCGIIQQTHVGNF